MAIFAWVTEKEQKINARLWYTSLKLHAVWLRKYVRITKAIPHTLSLSILSISASTFFIADCILFMCPLPNDGDEAAVRWVARLPFVFCASLSRYLHSVILVNLTHPI